MDFRLFGRTGVKVSPICIGAMNFGGPTDESESIRIIHTALDAGINFIDTANVYNEGRSELFVGKAIQGHREDIFLATKVHGRVGPGPNDERNSRFHILKACEDSLRRLNTDHIDLYQVHRPDPDIPVEETLSALTDLIHSGKVRYIGCSTHPAWMVMEALAVSERDHFARYISEQPPYNLLDRRIENELIPFALRYQIAIIPWAPLAQGLLTGRYSSNQPFPADSRVALQPGTIYSQRVTPPGIRAGEKFTALARECGKSPVQLAYLWCKDQPGITAPIVGPRNVQQLQDLLPVLDNSLGESERQKCDEINPPGGVVVNFHNTSGWMKTPWL